MHFHEFMLDVHQRIHAYKANHPRADPIPPVAADLAREARLLCFDEMQITDIADGEILLCVGCIIHSRLSSAISLFRRMWQQ